ncbi:uncharacterized protein LOC110884224 [Helianthus annuus]|uniref:uncharacterized protein LOC110884224 n=1 Tax=Helianthus annuus TaxID=4232 RepID=UPI000B8FFAEE|nr:uncharacterized protein LOC110884224 [Helianthus annuus]XP_035834514.1 uncharacterized protein LOC110884224 [Helianthus annuus]
MYQQAVAGITHISLGEEETVSPKKQISEAKQRELSGTLDSESETWLKKQISDAKNKELSGHNIFVALPEIQPHQLAARALALNESITIGQPTHNLGWVVLCKTKSVALTIPELTLEFMGSIVFNHEALKEYLELVFVFLGR